MNLEFFDCPNILAGQSAAGCPIFAPTVLGLNICVALHGFRVGSGDLTLVYVCVADTLLTELSPQPRGEEGLDAK